jgi:hypothetical protein
MTHQRRGLATRDQGVSGFSGPLMRLCDDVSAIAAALVDRDGETVDYAGSLSPFEARIMAAEWKLIMDASCREERPRCEVQILELALRASKRSFRAIALSAGYALVIQLPRHCVVVSDRALTEAVRTISEEAGLAIPPRYSGPGREWIRVDIQTRGNEGQPLALWAAGRWRQLEIIGRFREAGLRRASVGYRVRLDNSVELTIVREPLNRWYSDMAIK